MARIIFVRHGKPAYRGFYQPDRIIPGSLVAEMFVDYELTGLDKTYPPPQSVMQSISGTNTVLCSDLPRAIESAQWLIPEVQPVQNPVFQEAGLPYGYFQRLRLKPKVWMTFFRTLWLLGFHRNTESVNDIKRRARQGYDLIIETTNSCDSVLVVAHGFINIYMIRNFLSSGWKLSHSMQYGYWGCNEVRTH
jgi:broad specificity phosphatase PhoE